MDARKAADIPDGLVLEAIPEIHDRCTTGTGRYDRPTWVNRWDLAHVLSGNAHLVGLYLRQPRVRFDSRHAPGVPEKVLLAKLKSMKRRGLVDGCFCGCRADIQLPSV